MTEPTDQASYISELRQLDNEILSGRRRSHEAMHGYKRALAARDAAALDFERTGPKITHEQCIRDVSETTRLVKLGELPTPPEYTPNPSMVDQVAYYSRGAQYGQSSGNFRRGYIDPKTGRHVRGGTTQFPRAKPGIIPSMRPGDKQ